MPEEASIAKRAYYDWIVRPAIHRARNVVTVSEYSKGEIIEWSGVVADKIRQDQQAGRISMTRS